MPSQAMCAETPEHKAQTCLCQAIQLVGSAAPLTLCCDHNRCKVTEECFAHMTAMLQPIAPLAVLLEGGYNLSATAAATEACLRVLLGQRPPPLPLEDRAPSASGLAVIQHVIRTQVHTHIVKHIWT